MNKTQDKLLTAFVQNIPRSFVYEFKNRSYSSGPYAELLQNFAYYHKLTFIKHILEDTTSAEDIYKYLKKGIYNISTFSNIHHQTEHGIQHSYPVEWMQQCVMVPLDDEIPKFLYIIWPYGRFIWTAIFLGSIYIAILMRFIETRSGYVPTRSIIRNIPHALNITLYTMNMQAHLKNAPLRMLFFYMMLYFYGFILSAYHQPYMTAYNMKPIFLPPLNTVQDILKAELKVIITNNDFIDLQKTNLSNIKHINRNVSNTEFEELLKNYTRTYAYVVSDDQWMFMKKQQENLKKPYFHLTPLCFNAALRSFPVVANWKYATDFNMFLLRLQQSGLWKQWVDIAFARAVASGYAKILLDTYPVEPLNVEYFTIAWSVLTIGLSCSFIAIFIELFIWKQSTRQILVL